MWFYRIAHFVFTPLIRIYHRVEVSGLDRFDHKRHYIVVGNHVSHLDPFYIAAFYPNLLHFMAKREAFAHPVIRWFLNHLGAFPVSRESADVGSIKTALKLLKAGKSVGIFPEGRRQAEWDEQAFKQGAAYLSIKSGVPVLPVAVFGTKEAMPKGSKWIKPKKVRIMFGNPIEVTETISTEEMGNMLRNQIKSLLDQGAELT